MRALPAIYANSERGQVAQTRCHDVQRDRAVRLRVAVADKKRRLRLVASALRSQPEKSQREHQAGTGLGNKL